jgi:hypothetical protein
MCITQTRIAHKNNITIIKYLVIKYINYSIIIHIIFMKYKLYNIIYISKKNNLKYQNNLQQKYIMFKLN